MLETLAGAGSVADGFGSALASLRRALEADEVALVVRQPDGSAACRACSESGDEGNTSSATQAALEAAESAFSITGRDGAALPGSAAAGQRHLSVTFAAPAGRPRWWPAGSARRPRPT
jgi:hypothetical protein